MSGNDAFTFAVPIGNGSGCSMSIKTQPLGQTCTDAQGTGVVNQHGDPVTNVGLTRTSRSSTIELVAGLWADDGALTLGLNGVPLPIIASRSSPFPGMIPPRSTFSAAVITQRIGLTPRVSNASGVVAANAIAHVEVSCIRPGDEPELTSSSMTLPAKRTNSNASQG